MNRKERDKEAKEILEDIINAHLRLVKQLRVKPMCTDDSLTKTLADTMESVAEALLVLSLVLFDPKYNKSKIKQNL